MIQNWRFWVLAALLIAPPGVYIVLGAFWLASRGWLWVGFLTWTLAAISFSLLSVRWTRSTRQPSIAPLNWASPETFAPRDLEAWKAVQEAAEQADGVTIAELISSELFIQTGTRLASRLSEIYDPGAETPVEHVPIAELLTALELAAEDLNQMIREIPGGDLVTFAHGKAAVQAATIVSKANDYYNYLSPIFQPLQGILRLGASKLMTQPAWRDMQQNVLRWFYRAYVQRLGFHLIEMYSGRLSIGAMEYRRLTGRGVGTSMASGKAAHDPGMTLAVCGARGAGKTSLIAALEQLRSIDLPELEQLLSERSIDPELAVPLSRGSFVETESYGTRGDRDTFLDKLARRKTLSQTLKADLFLLVVDISRTDFQADARLVQAWVDAYTTKSGLQRPPALVLMTKSDRLFSTSPEASIQEPKRQPVELEDRISRFLEQMPREFHPKVVCLNLVRPEIKEIEEVLLPALASFLSESARGALIRHFHEHASRSKAGRFLKQVGKQGKKLWSQTITVGKKRVAPDPQDQQKPGRSDRVDA